MKLTLVAKRYETADVMSFIFKSDAPLTWQAGQFLSYTVPHPDSDDRGITRYFTIASAPFEGHVMLTTRFASGRSSSFKRALRQLPAGAAVEVGEPDGDFVLDDPSGEHILIAGGIGITPILPMLARAEADGATWTLLYGGRTASSMAFTSELAPHGDRVVVHPQDTHGLLDLDELLGTPRADTLVYCCGPEPLLAAVEDRMSAWPSGSLHLERFAAPVVERDPADQHAVEVVLAESGRSVLVPPDTSILQALLDDGVDVLHDCQDGICGSCETKVIEGEVDHRDFVLTEKEQAANDCMMVCVSRACGTRLVLGL